MKKSFFHKVRRRLFASERLLLYQHHLPRAQQSTAEIIKATPGNIQDVLYFDSPGNIDTYLDFMKHGDRGYLAYLDGNCVHRSWVSCKPGKVWLHWALPLEIDSNTAYIHFCETAPQARGKNIFSHVLSFIGEDMKEYEKILICVNDSNRASIRSIEKAGFVVSRKYRIIALLNQLIYKKEDE